MVLKVLVDVRRGNVLPAMVMRKPRFEVLVFFGPFALLYFVCLFLLLSIRSVVRVFMCASEVTRAQPSAG